MANYPKELTDLVKEYLTDGIISAKERQVLLKKAVALGVDADEFDLYIDAQQQKVDQEVDAAAKKKRGKTCPFCGGPVPQLADKCPHCDRIITAEASKELEELMSTMEKYLVEMKAGDIKQYQRNKAMLESVIRKAKTFYMSNEKVNLLVEELQQEIKKADNKVSKKQLFSFLQNNKKITYLLCAAVLCLVGAGFYFVKYHLVPDPTLHGEDCYNAVHEAIAKDDLSEANSILSAYEEKNDCYNDDYYSKAMHELADAYWEKGEYDKAVFVNSDYEAEACKKYIEKGDYVKALEYKNEDTRKQLGDHFLELENYDRVMEAYTGWGDQSRIIGAQICVSDMVEKGKKQEAETFITSIVSRFSDDDNNYNISKATARKTLLKLLKQE